MGDYYNTNEEDSDDCWSENEFDDDDDDDLVNQSHNGNNQSNGYPSEVYEAVDGEVANLNQYQSGFRPPPPRTVKETDRSQSLQNQPFPSPKGHCKPSTDSRSWHASNKINRQQPAVGTRNSQTLPPPLIRKSSSDEDYEITDEETPARRLTGEQFMKQLNQRIQHKSTKDKDSMQLLASSPAYSADDVYEVADASGISMETKSNIPRNAMQSPTAYPPSAESQSSQGRNSMKMNVQGTITSNEQGTPFSSHRQKPMGSEVRTMPSNFSAKPTAHAFNHSKAHPPRMPSGIPTTVNQDQSFPPPPDCLLQEDVYEPIENSPAITVPGNRGGPPSNQRLPERGGPKVLPVKPGAQCSTSKADLSAALAKHLPPPIQGRPQPVQRTKDIVNSPSKRVPMPTQSPPVIQSKSFQNTHAPVLPHRVNMVGSSTEERQNKHTIKEGRGEQAHSEKPRVLSHSTSQEKFPVYNPEKSAGMPKAPIKNVPLPAVPNKPALPKPTEKPPHLKVTPSSLIQDSKEKCVPLGIPKQKQPGTQSHLSSQCVALQDHSAGGDCLPFHRGDTIILTDTSNPYWWFGSLNGKTGRFPKNYVKVDLAQSGLEEIGREKNMLHAEKEDKGEVCKDIGLQSWYGGKMDRKNAESRLRSRNQNGCFYIRDTDKGDGYSMSLIHDSEITHLRVPFKDGGYFLGTSGVEKFDTVTDLVKYYTQNEVVLKTGRRTILLE